MPDYSSFSGAWEEVGANSSQSSHNVAHGFLGLPFRCVIDMASETQTGGLLAAGWEAVCVSEGGPWEPAWV